MKKKVLATAVLTAALAFGTAVPAFAESFSNNSADTKVSIFTDTSNISATLPLNPATGWTVAAGASNNELAIALSGTMSKASSTAQNSADKAVEAVKLTYKVSAA